MTIPRLFTACALMSVAACAGRYRTELVGQGTTFVQPRGTAAAPVAPEAAAPFILPAGGIQLTRGSYDLALWFDVPRAQTIDWTVSCPGATVNGSVGETFEQYRVRRIAALRAQRDRERQQMASVTSAVVGSFAPAAHATGHVDTPTGTVAVEGQAAVDPNAVGGAVAAAAIDDDVQLPPGDLGQGRLKHLVHVETAGDGVCAVTAATDDADVIGRYEVRRIHDLHAEARERAMAQTSHAVEVRKRLVANLVASGASPEIRERRLQAEARLRAETEARLQAEASARVQVTYEAHAQADARVRAFLGIAYDARQRYLAYLVGECHADPNRRARIEAEREAKERAEIEARARIDRELRDREQVRIDIAVRARLRLTAQLLALGAIERPPMPELVAENPGPPPFDGAHWTAGKWTWTGGRWIWTPGGWSDPDVFTATGGDVRVGGEISVGIGLGGGRGDGTGYTGSRDHRTPSTDSPSTDSPIVRDHRATEPTYVPPTRSEPVVRDHRSDAPAPAVRDHRKDDDKKSDDKKSDDKKDEPKVRDHRR